MRVERYRNVRTRAALEAAAMWLGYYVAMGLGFAFFVLVTVACAVVVTAAMLVIALFLAVHANR